jgi:hypothetical protein
MLKPLGGGKGSMVNKFVLSPESFTRYTNIIEVLRSSPASPTALAVGDLPSFSGGI